MNLFDQALLLLAAISAYIKSDEPNSASDAIDLVVELAGEGKLTQQKLQAITNTVKAMVAEGREPTDEEWAALRSRSDAAHATIQSADLGTSEEGTGGAGGSEVSPPAPTE